MKKDSCNVSGADLQPNLNFPTVSEQPQKYKGKQLHDTWGIRKRTTVQVHCLCISINPKNLQPFYKESAMKESAMKESAVKESVLLMFT